MFVIYRNARIRHGTNSNFFFDYHGLKAHNRKTNNVDNRYVKLVTKIVKSNVFLFLFIKTGVYHIHNINHRWIMFLKLKKKKFEKPDKN
jgi:hypothetical protein